MLIDYFQFNVSMLLRLWPDLSELSAATFETMLPPDKDARQDLSQDHIPETIWPQCLHVESWQTSSPQRLTRLWLKPSRDGYDDESKCASGPALG